MTKSRSEFEDRDKLLESFQKNHYLKKTKRPDTSGEEIEYDFTWGPRAKLEIPPQNMVNFLLQVMYNNRLLNCVYFFLKKKKLIYIFFVVL